MLEKIMKAVGKVGTPSIISFVGANTANVGLDVIDDVINTSCIPDLGEAHYSLNQVLPIGIGLIILGSACIIQASKLLYINLTYKSNHYVS